MISHSRRAFSGTWSNQEAELKALMWAVDSMRSLRQKNIIFEADFEQAREVLIWPEHFHWMGNLSTSIFGLLSSMESWCFAHVKSSRNRPATLIAASVTKDDQRQSYVARGGPFWLHSVLSEEKRRVNQNGAVWSPFLHPLVTVPIGVIYCSQFLLLFFHL